ncbi:MULTISPECIES: AAA family ATPase [unclassified Helicobacter]|uniref:AAA family ATPase n=1 Tax=unclassified Helicobacter TaxID=2593540 RepID=UPI000CF034FC|nr:MULTISPECIES: AAA family ATPase [unclassified Helicobacter]
MQELEKILEEKTQNFLLLPRRFGIKKGKTLLYGPPKSGKTSLALLFAKNYKHPIYIDCQDPRNNIDDLKNKILKAFLEKKIDLLILDNYQPIFTIPNIDNIILIHHKDLTKEGNLTSFISKLIMPLTFEEYISLINSQENTNQLLNHFIKEGNSLESFHSLDFQKISKKQNNMMLFFKEDYATFILLLNFQSQKITTNQIYLYVKKYLKISKDKLYALLSYLQLCKIIFLVPQKDSSNFQKKLYFYDFSLPYALCPNPNFQAIFENMVFLELYQQYKEKIVYDQNTHFIVNQTLFFAIAFPNQQHIEKILKENPNKQIIIIAINKSDHPSCKIIDFISFALKEHVE